MIIDEKTIMFPPPPPYLSSPTHPTLPSLPALPAHILLQIIYHTFPPANTPQEIKPEKQRKTLFWLSTYLRRVSRQFYTACMHILRSTYLPSYQSLIRPPYSSDPFPLKISASSESANGPPAYNSPVTDSPLLTLHRETAVLDRFIALKVRQDVFADDTELHTDREDAFRDLFDVAQPRARLEDLIRIYGVPEGLVSVPTHYVYSSSSQSSSMISLVPSLPKPEPPIASSSSPTQRRSIFSFRRSPPPSPSRQAPKPQLQITPLPFAALSVSFSPRRIGIVLNRSRTIAEAPRHGVGRNKESLEVLAHALIVELRIVLWG